MYRYYTKQESPRVSDHTEEMAAMKTGTKTESGKVRNLESAILFLQQEHANTLKCLHDEIRTLQKKNSELTFRIEMGPAVVSTSDSNLEEEVRLLKLELKSSRQQLEATTQDKDDRINHLEKQVKQQEKTFRDELKTYSSKFRKFQHELSIKADTIAELQMKLYSDQSGRRSSDSATRLVPTPPKEGIPRTRRGSRKTIVPIDMKAVPNDRPLSGGLRRDYVNVLDPTPFLIREGSPTALPPKRVHEPLPPINPQERTQSPLVRTRPEAEVVELALSHVQRSESWRHAPSHSSNLK